MTNQPHDALFKASLTPEAARALCRAVLPPEVARAFDAAVITRAPSEFVGEALRDRSSDVIYLARVDGEEVLIYLLFEHQSTVDRLMAFRVLRYMVRIWSQWLDHQEDRPQSLPAILPIVVYHGERTWNAPLSFQDLVELPAALTEAAELVPSFRFVLDDLTQLSHQQLRDRQAPTFAAVSWILLRRSHDPARGIDVWRDCADLIGELANQLPEQYGQLLQLVRYSLLRGFGDSTEIRAELRRLGGPEAEEVAVSTGEQLLEQGRQEGRQEGRLEVVREYLLRNLRRKWPVSPAAEREIQGATEAELRDWDERAATARSLEEVLNRAEPPNPRD